MNVVDKVIEKLGYVRAAQTEVLHKDLQTDAQFAAIYEQCKPYTMTSQERMYALYQSVLYLHHNNIAGDFVECGVWKGGSTMVMASTLAQVGAANRNLFLYDTFDGMSAPGAEDVDLDENPADKLLKKSTKDENSAIWAYSGLEAVQQNLAQTGYPAQQIQFVKGMVEDTIPKTLPGPIALLRLDTDWFDSTYHELTHLFPLVQKGGVVIIDDYGHWQGARKAVDQYFREQQLFPLLQRIDYTGRMFVKQ